MEAEEQREIARKTIVRVTELIRGEGIPPISFLESACLNLRGRSWNAEDVRNVIGGRDGMITFIAAAFREDIKRAAHIVGATLGRQPEASLLPMRKMVEDQAALDYHIEEMTRSGMEEKVLLCRLRFYIGVPGFIWTGRNTAGLSPTNEELAIRGNWEDY